MSQRRLLVIASAFVAVLAVPRESYALFEWLWEMSGPQMFGVAADCRIQFDGKLQSCKWAPSRAGAKDREDKDYWLTLGGGYYWSTDKTVNGQPYERGEVKMFAIDAMFEAESKSWDVSYSDRDLQLYQGVGASYNFLFGRGVPDSFSNLGLKLRPVGIVVPTSIVISIPKLGKFDLGVDASYDLRLYPRRFTAEDFGNPPLVPEGSGWEVVHGFVVGGRLSVKN